MGGLRRILIAFAAGAALLAVVVAVVQVPPAPAHCNDPAVAARGVDTVNIVRQLRSTEDGYELELWSREAFPVRAMPTVLRVGTIDSGLSRLGFDLHSIVFAIETADYEQMTTGDPILVHHTFIPPELEADPNLAGNIISTNGANLWTFGRFDKSQLDCPPLPLPAASEA